MNLFLVVALAPGALIVASALLVRVGALDWRSGYEAALTGSPGRMSLATGLTWLGVATGVIGVLLTPAAAPRGLARRTVVNLLVTAGTLAGLIYLHQLERAHPAIHDVATDWRRPLDFSPFSLAQRGPTAEPVSLDPVVAEGRDAGRRIARLNAEFCPAARPLELTIPAPAAYARAKAALREAGLVLTAENPDEGRLEATSTGRIYGFTDDVVFRIQSAGAGSRIDIRSVGRLARPDLGANCRRVTALLEALRGG